MTRLMITLALVTACSPGRDLDHAQRDAEPVVLKVATPVQCIPISGLFPCSERDLVQDTEIDCSKTAHDVLSTCNRFSNASVACGKRFDSVVRRCERSRARARDQDSPSECIQQTIDALHDCRINGPDGVDPSGCTEQSEVVWGACERAEGQP